MTVTNIPSGLSRRVGAEIKALMGRRGVSQVKLAAAIGVDQSQLSKRLRGAMTIDVDELNLIAAYFGTTASALLVEAERNEEDEWAPWGSNPQPAGCRGVVTSGYPNRVLDAEAA